MHYNNQAVVGVHMETGERLHFATMKEAARALGAAQSSISYAVNTGHSIKGYHWYREGELDEV